MRARRKKNSNHFTVMIVPHYNENVLSLKIPGLAVKIGLPVTLVLAALMIYFSFSTGDLSALENENEQLRAVIDAQNADIGEIMAGRQIDAEGEEEGKDYAFVDSGDDWAAETDGDLLITEQHSDSAEIIILKRIINELESENLDLKETLMIRDDTYDQAVSMQGADIPVLSPSGFTPGMFERAWKNMNTPHMKGTGDALVRAEEETGVNALVLAAIAAHESGFGSSKIARDKNNLFGFGAYDGSAYESAIAYASVDEGILDVANFLDRNYLSRSGRHYNGDNLQAINIRYAPYTPAWSRKVANIMRSIVQSIEEN